MVAIFVINRTIALIINHDSHIHARAIAAVEIHFFHFAEFFSSFPAEKTKNPQYNRYRRATKANIHKIQLIAI